MSADEQVMAAPRTPRGRPKLEDVAAIEQRLLAVALQAFIAHGYGGASLRGIVKTAGISKTTLYSRFASKEQLFRAIMRQQIDRVAAAMPLRSRMAALGLEQGLKVYASNMLQLSLEGDLLAINRLIYAESHRFPELGAAAAERTSVGIQQVAAFIRDRAISDAIPCRDPEAVAEAFIMMLRGWYVDVILANGAPPRAQRERWVERAVHALTSARGDW